MLSEGCIIRARLHAFPGKRAPRAHLRLGVCLDEHVDGVVVVVVGAADGPLLCAALAADHDLGARLLLHLLLRRPARPNHQSDEVVVGVPDVVKGW